MALLPHVGARSGNRLLAALPSPEYDRLTRHLQAISLPLKKILYEPEDPLSYVYFARLGCVTSLLIVASHGRAVNVAAVGYEGMIGVPLFLGADTMTHRVLVQIPGEALRLRVKP